MGQEFLILFLVPVGTLLCASANKIYMANHITPDKPGTEENRTVSASACLALHQ